jgi:uncharacterized protein
MTRRDVVLDTGPIVAAFDPRDQWHASAVAAWPQLVDRCVTTEAVVVEASHMIHRGGGSAWSALEFLLEAGIPIVGLDVASHRRAMSLMRRCERVPMDYADATLVVAAEALGMTSAFTFDRRGFSAYARLLRIPFVQYPSS